MAPALEVFARKIIPQMLYGPQIGGFSQISCFESIQNNFICLLLGVPKPTLSSLIRAEVGLISISTHCHTALALFWYSLVSMSPSRLPKRCFIKQSANPTLLSWVSLVRPVLDSYDLSVSALPSYYSPRINILLKDSIRLYHMRYDLSISPCSTLPVHSGYYFTKQPLSLKII